MSIDVSHAVSMQGEMETEGREVTHVHQWLRFLSLSHIEDATVTEKKKDFWKHHQENFDDGLCDFDVMFICLGKSLELMQSTIMSESRLFPMCIKNILLKYTKHKIK